MAFTTYEFPYTRTYDGDLGFLIKQYNELISEYKSLTKDIEYVKKFAETLDERVSAAIKVAMDKFTAEVNATLAKYDARITATENRAVLLFFLAVSFITNQPFPFFCVTDFKTNFCQKFCHYSSFSIHDIISYIRLFHIIPKPVHSLVMPLVAIDNARLRLADIGIQFLQHLCL